MTYRNDIDLESYVFNSTVMEYNIEGFFSEARWANKRKNEYPLNFFLLFKPLSFHAVKTYQPGGYPHPQ